MAGLVGGCDAASRLWPMANDVNATGISGTNGLLFASSRLPLITAVRPGLPSLKITTPVAPAALAFSTRPPVVAAATLDQRALAWVKLLKSAEAQPLVEL